jgi:hypothetical protein
LFFLVMKKDKSQLCARRKENRQRGGTNQVY